MGFESSCWSMEESSFDLKSTSFAFIAIELINRSGSNSSLSECFCSCLKTERLWHSTDNQGWSQVYSSVLKSDDCPVTAMISDSSICSGFCFSQDQHLRPGHDLPTSVSSFSHLKKYVHYLDS